MENSLVNRQSPNKSIFLVCFSVAAALIVLLTYVFSGRYDRQGSDGVTSISEGWKDQTGQICSIDDAHTNKDGIPVVLEKKLIQGYTGMECLCFSSCDVSVKVYLDDKEIYSFLPRANFTGKGYGTAFHEIDLPQDLGGRILRIVFESPDTAPDHTRGYITDVYLGSAMSYAHMLFDRKAVSVVISIFVVFFGMILVLINLAVKKNERMPFDIASLGVSAILLGAWLFMVTDIIQLLTGHIYSVRVLNRVLIFLVGYPLIRFFNSLTSKKRQIYPIIMFSYTCFTLLLLVVLRYGASIDMLDSFTYVLVAYCIVVAAVCIVMFVDDEIYCRANGTPSRLKMYYLCVAIFVLCIFADIGLYLMRRIVGNDIYGVATRTGTLILIAVVLRQFITWWTRDRAVIERGRLISKSLSVATSGLTPDECIRQIIEDTAVQFGAKRAVIFEDQMNGKYHGTYVWFDPTSGMRATELLYLQQKGFVDEIERVYEANGKRFAIDDPESFKNINANIYSILRSQNVQSIVLAPLGSGGKTTGLIVFMDLPSEMMEDAADNAELIAYFISELILKRDEEKRTRIFYYNDPFSGALNRRAFNEFAADGFDKSAPFGLLIVEIKDLEIVSATKGYEVGDKLVSDTVSVMSDIFGRENVFRLVGSRFAAFGFESDEAYFEDDAERLVKEAKAMNIALAIGCAFCNNGTNDINTVIKYAADNVH